MVNKKKVELKENSSLDNGYNKLGKEVKKNTERNKEIETLENNLKFIKDEKLKKEIKKMIIEDKKNFDKKTKQYLGRFEISFENSWTSDEENNEKDLKGRINNLMDRIDTLYWRIGLGHLTEKLKEKIIGLFYYIKGDIKENYTWNLDFKILELIEKNLPNYKISYPGTIDRKQWELIKAKLSHLSRVLLKNEGECIYNIMDKYSMEWEVDGVKLRYWLISKEEYNKKIKECYEEEEQMKKEFQQLLGEYLFNLWD